MADSYNELFGLGSHSVDANLEGWYLLDETAASTSVADSSGNTRTGTIVGGNTAAGLTTSGPGGPFPNAFQFDGSLDYVSLPAGVDGIGKPKSLLGRFNADTHATRRIWGSSSTDRNYLSTDGSGFLVTQWGAGSAITASTANSTATWYSAATTIDGSGNVVVYRNGASDGTSTGEDSTGGANINIGSNNDGGGSFWDGALCDCSIWSRALSGTEVAQWHAGPEPLYGGGGIGAPTGTTTVGSTLTAQTDSGNWDGQSNGTVTYQYQWIRANDAIGTGAADIGGATSSTYTLVAGDSSKYIACRIRGLNDGGFDSGEDTTSSYTAQVTGGASGSTPYYYYAQL